MRQRNYIIRRRKNKHINYEERVLIEHLYNIQKLNKSEIARQIGKHRTTISREIKKGLVTLKNSDYSERKEYVARKAQETYDINATAKGPSLKIANDHKLATYIENMIKEKYSPEVIVEKMCKNKELKTKIHWKTIYNYIDKKIIDIDREDLTYGKYKTKNKGKKKESLVKKINKEGRTIHDRPQEVDQRRELGHWEMDVVIGKKKGKEPVLLVLSERKSRREKIVLMKDKTQASVIKALDKIERRMGARKFRKTFKTITTDNGSEFLNYKGIERSYTKSKKPRVKQYYADAYSSWQRGTNENINKMIRRFLPKGQSFKGLTNEEVERIERWINNYPRKMFGFKSSNEIYSEYIAA
jgi:IS30 family transposase